MTINSASQNVSKKVIRAKQVIAKLGISRTTFYDWQNKKSTRYNPSFPKKIQMGISTVGWFEHEIDAWLEDRLARN